MAKIRRLVLDVVIPHTAEVINLTQDLADEPSIDGANSMVSEIDKSVTNIKITIEGTNVSYQKTEDIIKAHGGAIHSIDNVVAGKTIIEDVETPQD